MTTPEDAIRRDAFNHVQNAIELLAKLVIQEPSASPFTESFTNDLRDALCRLIEARKLIK